MTPERMEQIGEVLEKALALDAAKRGKYLDEACASDAELRREVESLLDSHEQAGSQFLNESAISGLGSPKTAGRDEVRAGRRVGPYLVEKEIGHGGMGEVFSAVRADGQYEKKVAIKLVRSGYDTESILERFRNERQILAGLDHPNIARLLDGDTTDDGIPYLVMELVEGAPIDDYCDAHKLNITSRLQLFHQVCGAVQYAQQRLVIHRDLKPSNILVTPEGNPKLLDFGIAKLLDSSGSTEATMLRPMTPEYASPEQILGDPITTASDVYSLGVVLYRLLTGHFPYRLDTRKPANLAEAITHDEPERPSISVQRTENLSFAGTSHELNPENVSSTREASPFRLQQRLQGDLDFILLKALRKEPDKRYSSVEQFSEDIRRHLEGVPIAARKGTWSYRTGKFIRRHRVGVAAAALLFATLLTGVILVVREARIAEANRKRAEARFNDVRKLANSLMFEIHDSIQDLPGATQARKLLIKRALQYLDSLAQESGGDPSLQRELATAYARVGDLQIYRGGPEDTAGRMASYQKALAIRETLYASNPGNIGDAMGLADSSRQMAEALLEDGQPAQALPYSNRAVQISEQFAQAEPSNTAVLEELAHDYANQGNVLAGDLNWSNLGENAAALLVRHKQVEIATRVASLEPDLPAARRRMGDAIIMLGDQLLLDGQRRNAHLQYLQALKIMQALLGHLQSAQLLNDSDALYQRLANVALESGALREAEVACRKALESSEKLSRTDAQNIWAQVMLAEDNALLANVLSRTGKHKEAASFLGRALIIIGGVARLNPENTDVLGTQADIYVTAGGIFSGSAKPAEALRYYRNAIDIYSRVQAKQPGNVGIRLFLAAAYNGLGKVQARQRDFQGASEAYNKALNFTDPGTSSVHRSAEAFCMMATSYAGLGGLEATQAKDTSNMTARQTRHWRQAQVWYELSAKILALIKEPGTTSPNGFECVPLTLVNKQLARCNAVLQDLKDGSDKSGELARTR